jgi:hypothetical protein
MAEKKTKSVSLPNATYDLLCGVALHAGPDVGRRIALHEIVTASLIIAQQQHDQLRAILLGEQPSPTAQAGAEAAA